ncbi:MAG: ThiF family adenylyltransferase [Bacilli bacterium]|nr:ThiF family adenylyltransferase [Bacilli bacterium]
MLERLELILDKKMIDKFCNSNILIVGVGGVGGACFEALVRLGIKNVTVIDKDDFDLSNLNRQILSSRSNIGKKKVLEARLRALSINPDICVECIDMFLNEANIDEIDFMKYDYIVDCCDTMTTKLLLIQKSIQYNVKIISSMGTGNRLDPTKLVLTDIWKTEYDPVAKAMRKLLRDNNIRNKIPVLLSKEQPIKIQSRKPGSTSLVPNVAGFYIASYVFNDIINSGK